MHTLSVEVMAMVTIGALVLYVVFVALGFGWRSWRQSRRTGSTGFRGISGRPGTPEWLAGVGFVVAMILGLLAPALQVVGGVSPIGAAEVPILQALGTVLAVTGIAGTLYAQNDMGESWRIGVDARETTTLVREGVFALVRNPIFTAMLVFATGIALMVPNVVALAALALLVASIEVQVRVVEEPHLMRVHGDSYQSYGQVVGRFLPMLGRLDRTE
ncbi:methyltransferase family protein [Mycolicibacterium hodleri]|nr:isoprenylcysteine carboxylmethyltransferase family protein [Mycolicibacterium hodleri]